MNLSDLPPGTPTIQFPGGCISRPTTGEVYETIGGKTRRLYTLDEARHVLVSGYPVAIREYTHGKEGDGEIVTTPDDRIRADWSCA